MILDTNAVTRIMAGDEGLGHVIGKSKGHHLPLQVIGEYQFGLLALGKRKRYESIFRKLEADSDVLCPDRTTADWYAIIRHDLKRSGKPIPESDLWIAALARQYAVEVVSNDEHFDNVEGIHRIGW